jgi:hypothetical protein
MWIAIRATVGLARGVCTAIRAASYPDELIGGPMQAELVVRVSERA